MNRIYILLVLVVWSFCRLELDPHCETLTSLPIRQYLTSDQSYYLKLSQYFKGTNLTFSTQNFSLAQKIVKVDTITFEDPLDQQIEDRITTNIFKDTSGKVWGQTSFTFKISTEEGYQYAFGNTTDKNNVEFGEWRTLPTDMEKPVMCFDTVLVSEDVAWIGCQYREWKQNRAGNISSVDWDMYDQWYVVNRDVEEQPQIFTFDAVTSTLARWNVLLQIGDDTFVIDLMPSPWIHYDFQSQTYLTIYHVDQQTSAPQFAMIVDSFSFGVERLTITDIAVDSDNNIFITDRYFGLRSFKYYPSNSIQVGPSWQNPTQKQCYRVGVVSREESTTVLVVTEEEIAEFEWTEEEIQKVGSYELGQFTSEETDYALVVNNDYFVLKLMDTAYVYRFGEESIKGLFGAIDVGQMAEIDMSKLSNQIVVVGYFTSDVYRFSDEYVKLDHIAQDISTIVTATSAIIKKEPVTCELNLTIKSISDITEIIAMDTVPVYRLPNFIIKEYSLQTFFLGNMLDFYFTNSSDLSYTSLIQQQLSQNQKQIIYPFNVTATQILDWDQHDNYFYWWKKDMLKMTLNMCIVREQTLCQQIKSQPSEPNPVLYAGLVSNEDDEPDFLYVVGPTPNQILFMGSQKTLTFSNNITHLHGIPDHRLCYVTLSKTSIQVLSIEDDYELFTTISRDTFTLDQVDIFKPQEVKITKSSILMIRNVNSVVLVRVIEQTGQVIFLANVKVSHAVEVGWQWASFVGAEGKSLLIVQVKAQPYEHAIEEYSLVDIHNHNVVLMKSIKLLEGVQLSPNLVYSATDKHVFLRTMNESILVLLFGEPAISSQPILIKTNYKIQAFASASLQQSSLLQVLTDKFQIGNSLLIFNEPALSFSIHSPSNNWTKTLSIDVLVQNPKHSAHFVTQIKILNNEPALKTTGNTNQKMLLPRNADDYERDLNFRSLIEGPIAELDLECPMCDGDQIVLTEFFDEIDDADQIQDAKNYLYFGEENVVWTLANKIIYVLDVQGKKVQGGEIPLSFIPNSGKCTSWIQYNQSSLIIFCEYSEDLNIFVFVEMSKDKRTGRISSPIITISEKQKPVHVLTMKIAKNWLFVMDNELEGDGMGCIRVFQVVDGSTSTEIIFKQVISAQAFIPESKDILIEDLDILSTRMLDEDSRQVLLASLTQFKLGYGVYDPGATQFQLQDIHTIDFEDYFAEYSVQNNYLLQIEVLASISYRNGTDTFVEADTVVTTASGVHLRFGLELQFDANLKVISHNLKFVKALRNYGNLDVLNWAQSIQAQGDRKEQLMVAYWDEDEQALSFVWYDLGEGTQSQDPATPQWFTAALATEQDPSQNPFITGFFFQTPDQLLFLCNSDPSSHALYTLSPNISLVMNYDTSGNFSTITLKASNAYHEVSVGLDVEFRQPVPVDDGLKWYVIVIIACGCGIVLLGIVGVVVSVVRRRRQREQLLLEEKSDIDTSLKQ